MLESASRSDEGPFHFARKTDCAERAFHTAVWAAGTAPDRVTLPQSGFGIAVIQGIGVQPQRFGMQCSMLGCVDNRRLGREMKFIRWTVIGDDADSDGLLHVIRESETCRARRLFASTFQARYSIASLPVLEP